MMWSKPLKCFLEVTKTMANEEKKDFNAMLHDMTK